MHIKSYNSVIPVKTGIQIELNFFKKMDSHFHGNDRMKDIS